MGKIKQVNIKSWTYYFYNDQIKRFSYKFVKSWQKNYKEIYCIGYVTVKEQSGNKCLVLHDVNENKEASKNMKNFGKVLTKKLK